MAYVPLPATINLLQFSCCTIFVYGAACAGVLVVDGFVWSIVRYYLVYVVFFSIGTYANMRVLPLTNVETLIGMCYTTQSSSPCR